MCWAFSSCFMCFLATCLHFPRVLRRFGCVLGLFLVFYVLFGNLFAFSSCFTAVCAVWGSNLRNPSRKSPKSIVRRRFSLLSVIFTFFSAFVIPLPSQPGSTAPAYASPSPNARSRKRSESTSERSRKRVRLQNRFWVDLGSIFLVDPGRVFGRFWDDVWSLFGLITYMSCNANARSMHSQVYLFSVFLGVVFGCRFSSLLGGPKTVLEPNMAPTWLDFGAMLEPFWDIFGCCFGIFI